jgi:hypothetical protein
VYAGQAAAIAQDPVLTGIFPIFRAHPLLVQSVVALGFSFGVSDLVGRLVAATIGLATICLVYLLGRDLFGRRTGLLAALFIALMPYHVVVTRQVLLDGPMAFCATLALFCVARFASTEKPAWLYASGAAMGLTFLCKETGIILIGAIYAFLALTPALRLRLHDIAFSLLAMVLVIAPFPLSLFLAGGGGSERAQQYLVWQLFRRPNHDWDFYLTTVPQAIGPLLLLAALVGIVAFWRDRTWRETLLVLWIIVPVVFFELWPVKGFQYLVPIAPPLAILAARPLAAWSGGPGIGRFEQPLRRFSTRVRVGWARLLAAPAARPRPAWTRDPRIERLAQSLRGRWLQPFAVLIVSLSLILPTWSAVQATDRPMFLAGTGGVPGGREAGEWVRDHAPEGARLLTIGPSMANIIQFYGHRHAYGLSVSPNPLNRNPAYDPVNNPDLDIRNNDLQYLVWDSFSASRSLFFSDSLMRYVARYHGRAVHTESVTVTAPSGARVDQPVIVIYEVRP